MTLLEQAFKAAAEYHDGGFRKNTKIQIPYICHPVVVMKKLTDWRIYDEEILAAALLHDVVEDTECSLDGLKMDFNDKVCLYVEEMTQEDGLSKEDYLERFAKCSIEAFVIKISDRLCNIMDFAYEHKYPKYFKSLQRFFTLVNERQQEIIDRFGEKTLTRIYTDFMQCRDFLESEYNFSVELS